MLYIEKTNINDFNDLNNRIQAHRVATITGYNAITWAEPLYSLDKTKIACPINEEDYSVLNGDETPIELNESEYFLPSNK